MKDALLKGKAGEYFVCYDLSSKGIVAYPSDQGLSYDVVADIEGKLLKIQVKTTTKQRATNRKDSLPSYIFHTKKCGKWGKNVYKNNECDIVAFVCLPEKEVAYLPIWELAQTTCFRVSKHKGEYSDEVFAKQREQINLLRENGFTLEKIGAQLGISKSSVSQILRRKLNPRPARFFSQYPFDIACKRIEEAYRQPDMFIEPPKKAEQYGLL